MKTHQPVRGAKKPGSSTLPGPHLCSAVGTNVSTVLRAAMMEMCEHHGGSLSRDGINHVFDLVMSSSQLFFLYRQGYSNCVSLKNSPQFIDIDAMTITHFIVRSYCQDLTTQVCRKQSALRKSVWSTAFVDGLVDYLCETIDPDLPRRVFPVYQELVTRQGGSLTPITILNAPDMVTAFVRTVIRLETRLHIDAKAAEHLETVVNASLIRSLTIEEPSPELLDRPASLAVLMGLTKSSAKNPFRSAVLKETSHHLSNTPDSSVPTASSLAASG